MISNHAITVFDLLACVGVGCFVALMVAFFFDKGP
jgi:hypothetical protein